MDYMQELVLLNRVAFQGAIEGKLDAIESAVIRVEQNVVEVPPSVVAEMEDDRG